MKRIAIFIVLMLTCGTAQASALSSCQGQIKYGPPSESGVLLCRLGYVLSYNTAHKTADWVAFHLTREDMHGNIPRTNDYRPDPDMAADQQAQIADYAHSKYMRGQLVPASSMRWDARAMSESFLLSSIAPRVPAMNDGIWKALNQKVNDWVNSRGELYVVDGPVYTSDHPTTTGPDKVAVPDSFYMVIFDPVHVDAIAFIIPNHKAKASDMPKFITSVARVEQLTGLDFLPRLDSGVKSLIETRSDPFWIR